SEDRPFPLGSHFGNRSLSLFFAGHCLSSSPNFFWPPHRPLPSRHPRDPRLAPHSILRVRPFLHRENPYWVGVFDHPDALLFCFYLDGSFVLLRPIKKKTKTTGLRLC